MTAYSDTDIYKSMCLDVSHPKSIRIIYLSEGVRMQPASVDLTLGSNFLCFTDPPTVVDSRNKRVETAPLGVGRGYFRLPAGGFILGETQQRVELGAAIVGRVEGKSSLGRIGLMVHVSAGFVDPGFRGKITLELHNVSKNAILLHPGIAICQIAFTECKSPATKPYGSDGLGSHYQDATGVEPAKS